MLRQCCELAHGTSPQNWLPGSLKGTQLLLQRLHKEMREQEGSPGQRHLAFMLLQFLGGNPTNLYKEAVGEIPIGGQFTASRSRGSLSLVKLYNQLMANRPLARENLTQQERQEQHNH